MKQLSLLSAFGVALLVALPCAAQTDTAAADPTVSTYSILGFDPETGELGVAVQSRVFSVGNGVIWADAGVGLVATQAMANIGYGPRALELLASGLSAEQVVGRLLEEDVDSRRTGPRPVGRSR